MTFDNEDLKAGDYLCECETRRCGFHHAKNGYSCDKVATVVMADPKLSKRQVGTALCDDCKLVYANLGWKVVSDPR